MHVRIYTDGACSGNPGPGGWGAVLLFEDGKQEISGNSEETTNNRMELKAVIEALKLARSLQADIVTIYSDSAYVVNAVSAGWLKRWESTKWKTVAGTDVKNKVMWIVLLELMRAMEIKFVKVKGHSGDNYNERADELARKEVDKYKLKSL